MKDKDLKKLKKNATALRHIVEAENNPAVLANMDGLTVTSPYSARLTWIFEGHVWEANLTVMDLFREHEGEPFAFAFYKMDGELVHNRNYVRNVLDYMEDEIKAEEARRAAAIARKRAKQAAEEEEEEEEEAQAKQRRAVASRRKAAALRMQEIMANGYGSMVDSLHTKYVAMRGGMLVEEGPDAYRWRYGDAGLADLRQEAMELGVAL